MKLKYWMAVVLVVPIAIAGCGAGEEKASSSSVSGPDDPDAAPPNVVNGLGFYLKVVDEDKFLSYMSKGTAFNTDCLVAQNETATQDLACTIDIQEGDLLFHGLTLNYNVSPDMCTYMTMTPYFYYNYESGQGPSAVTLAVTETAGVNTVTACSVTTESGAVAGCTGQLEVSIDTANVEVTCTYDKTSTGGKNCCFGNYTLTKNITGDRVATDVTTAGWGGKYESCLGGPDWSARSASGWPRSVIYYSAGGGLNGTYKIPAPLNKVKSHNYSAANYYAGISSPGAASAMNHTHNGFVSATSSTLPYAVAPIDDRDGSLLASANPSYMFKCLDTAFEVKHRIQVYVREWNTYTQFLAYGTSTGVSGNADVGGVEDGVDCNYGFALESCNDGYDWDDLLNYQDADFDITTDLYNTAPGSEALRINYFPGEE